MSKAKSTTQAKREKPGEKSGNTPHKWQEGKSMTDMNKINDAALDQVVGGKTRIVNTGTSQNAAVRAGAGKGFEQIDSLANGTRVNATGVFKEADGRSWAQIDAPVYGWIAASILGYDR